MPGHQIVGVGRGTGARVGVPWLGWTCGECRFCRSGRENLCDRARFTGCDIDGGFAELRRGRRALLLPDPRRLSRPSQAAPLLCAGLIGYRALRMAGDAQRLGLYGFGAAAHIVCQVAVHEGRRVFAFTRAGDADGAGASPASSAPSGRATPPTPAARAARRRAHLRAGRRARPGRAARARQGGTVVCAGIHMSDIPSFPYGRPVGRAHAALRGEPHPRRRRGVPRARAARAGPHARDRYPLERANEALDDLRAGRVTGAAVLMPLGPRRRLARAAAEACPCAGLPRSSSLAARPRRSTPAGSRDREGDQQHLDRHEERGQQPSSPSSVRSAKPGLVAVVPAGAETAAKISRMIASAASPAACRGSSAHQEARRCRARGRRSAAPWRPRAFPAADRSAIRRAEVSSSRTRPRRPSTRPCRGWGARSVIAFGSAMAARPYNLVTLSADCRRGRRRAGVAELVDARGLGPRGRKAWGFESLRPHR